MILHKVGFYREMPYAEHTDPSIFDFIHTSQQTAYKEEIISYLRSGVALVVCCGVSYDVIDESKGVAGTPSLLTDGTWVWPADIAYYVSEYNLQLPCEFIEHMKANSWEVLIKEDFVNQDYCVQ